MHRLILPTLVASLLVATGCECATNVGADEHDAGRPATPRTDLCGNGIDDDQNGAIDDGCPCGPGEVQRCSLGTVAESEVGACMAGTQTCAVASGVEWGDWGDYACSGAVGPAETEACDGVDDDCDGTIDEGCPCDEGATRACATEFLTAPCTAGTQSCSGGTWSSCEGAVTPSAEVCGDGVDNDCDGTVDPAILCACVPSAEVCRDGVDNDCDGATDEAECTPDWPGDAGVPNDAGACGVTGCTEDCTCTLGAESDFGPGRFFDGTASAYTVPVEWGDAAVDEASAWNDRDRELALLFTTRQRGGDPVEVHLERWTTDGRLIGEANLGTFLDPHFDSFRWASDHYELRGYYEVSSALEPFWWVIPASGDSHSDFDNDAFTTDMALTNPLVTSPFEASPVILQHEGRPYAVWNECHEFTETGLVVFGSPLSICSRSVFFGQEVTSDLRPSGVRTTLLTTSGTHASSWTVISTGEELAIAAFYFRVIETIPSFPSLYQGPVLFVSNGPDWVTIEDPPVVRDSIVATQPALIADEDRILSCYARAEGGGSVEYAPLACRLASRAGEPIGEPFDASVDRADPTFGVYAFRTGCGFAVVSRQTYFNASGERTGTFGLSRIDPGLGFVDSQRLMPETTLRNELFAYANGDDVAILRYETDPESGTGRTQYQMHQRLLDCP